jgi:hypothetical protein
MIGSIKMAPPARFQRATFRLGVQVILLCWIKRYVADNHALFWYPYAKLVKSKQFV